MRFDDSDQADTSEVEDRRGMSFPGGRMGAGVGGLGLVGTLLFIAIRLLGGDVVIDNGGGQANPTNATNGSGASHGANPPWPSSPSSLEGPCTGVTSASDPAKFVVCVETNVQKFWRSELSNPPYIPAKLVLFTDATPSGCGTASADTGPFYCPEDQKVYLDVGFFQELHDKFGAKGGDFAEAYVVAHEYGHRVQDVLGIEAKMRRLQDRHPAEQNPLSVRLELQADCFAGVWGHSAYKSGKVQRSEIADALDAAAAVGDDRIQKEMRGRVNPETFTHGSAADRQKWFEAGMNSGDPAACNTFAGTPISP